MQLVIKVFKVKKLCKKVEGYENENYRYDAFKIVLLRKYQNTKYGERRTQQILILLFNEKHYRLNLETHSEKILTISLNRRMGIEDI